MILIVDDRPENIFSLKSILEQNAFETDAAHSGEEALKKVLKNEYALIILDVQMPGMDGFEVAEAISGLNKTRDVPIIFLSAVSTHKRFVTKGFESGAVDYITKPVDPDILILKVRNFYRLFEKTFALREAERKLSATVTELHTTLESLPQLAFTANAAGRIEFVNQHWYEYAKSKDEFPEAAPGDASLQQQWAAAVASGTPLECEVRIHNRYDGKEYYHLLRARPVDLGGQIVKWVGTFTNIHGQRMLNEFLEQKVAERTRELTDINHKLELSNHDLQQFASVASHDLKEPLRKIQFYSNMILERSQLDDAVSKYLEKIVRSSERMSNLITDLLSFTRLSAADVFQPSDLNEIIRDILGDLELVVQEKAAQISVASLPTIEGIPGLLRQLFLNVLGNALKFSRTDRAPQISIEANTVNGFCVLQIKDNGIGFNEQYTSKIFTMFQRLNTREQYDGTGIGLAIAKKIVDKHHGSIAARSKEGEGSTFIISLPLTQQPSVEGTAEAFNANTPINSLPA